MNSNPPVAIFASQFHPHVGGVEEVVRQLAHELQLRRQSPIVIANRWPRLLPSHELIDGIDVYRLPYRVPCGGMRVKASYWLTTSCIRRQLVQIFRRHAPRLIHLQCVSSGAIYALHVKRKLGLPMVVTLQGELTMDADQIFQRDAYTARLLREVLAEADVITACSARTLADAEAFCGLPFGNRARVIFNGARADDFAGASPFAHSRPYVLALGRLVRQKGFDMLLRAFAAARVAQWDLIIAGDGVERESLQRLTAELGLGGAVTFAGQVDRKTAVSLVAGSQLLVVPSRGDEGLPVVIAEAMSAGRPVLATRVGGIPEAVVHGQTGLLVERDDVSAMAAALSQLADDDLLRDRLAAGAKKRASAFTWPTLTDQYEEVYREACDHRLINANRNSNADARSLARPLNHA